MCYKVELEKIKLAKNGDNDAITDLINEYKVPIKIKSRTFYLVGGEQEDLLQEGLIGLVNAINNFDENRGIKFSTFANVCITRQMIDAIKLANRDKHTILNNAYSLNKISHTVNDEEFELLELLKDTTINNPEDIVMSKEGIKDIMETIENSLSDFEKDVLSDYLNGDNYSIIAERLNKDKKAIDNALQRIRRKLEKNLV